MPISSAIALALEPLDEKTTQTGHARQVLVLLNSPEFQGPPSHTPEEMEATIQENHHAWE